MIGPLAAQRTMGRVLSVSYGSAAWSLLDLPTLVRLFQSSKGTFQDAAMTIPAVSDDDPVEGWADQSGQGGHATQSTEISIPKLKLNILNGQPAVQFDGGDFLNLSEFMNFSEFTIFGVFVAGASGYQYLLSDYGNVAGETMYLLSTSGALQGYVRDIALDSIVVTNGLATTFHIATLRLSGTTLELFRNGSVVSNTNAAYSPTTWEGTYSPPRIGAWPGTPASSFLVGYVAALGICSSALSDESLLLAHQYLSNEYNIALA